MNLFFAPQPHFQGRLRGLAAASTQITATSARILPDHGYSPHWQARTHDRYQQRAQQLRIWRKRMLTTSVKCAACNLPRARIGRPGQLMTAAVLLLLQFSAEALPMLRHSGRGLPGKPADAARGFFAGEVDPRTGPAHSHRTASEPLRLYGGKRRDVPKPRGVRKGEVSTLKVPVFKANSCTLIRLTALPVD